MANLILKISTNSTTQQVRDLLSFNSKNANDFFKNLSSLSNVNCEVQLLNGDGANASATITIDNSKISADDILQIADVSFTAKASGASGLQFNIGVSATATAANLAASINTSSAVQFVGSKVLATSAAGVVTIAAVENTNLGNLIYLAKTEAVSGSFTLAGSRLGGGQVDSAPSKNFKSF